MAEQKKWEVTTEEVRRSASLIKTKTEDYQTAYNKLYAELTDMKGVHWSGVANDAFNTQLEGFRNDFEDMTEVLLSYSQYLETAAKNYEDTEEEIRSAAVSKLKTGN